MYADSQLCLYHSRLRKQRWRVEWDPTGECGQSPIWTTDYSFALNSVLFFNAIFEFVLVLFAHGAYSVGQLYLIKDTHIETTKTQYIQHAKSGQNFRAGIQIQTTNHVVLVLDFVSTVVKACKCCIIESHVISSRTMSYWKSQKHQAVTTQTDIFQKNIKPYIFHRIKIF